MSKVAVCFENCMILSSRENCDDPDSDMSWSIWFLSKKSFGRRLPIPSKVGQIRDIEKTEYATFESTEEAKSFIKKHWKEMMDCGCLPGTNIYAINMDFKDMEKKLIMGRQDVGIAFSMWAGGEKRAKECGATDEDIEIFYEKYCPDKDLSGTPYSVRSEAKSNA